MFLDATYLHVREPARAQVVSQAVVVATGVTEDGGREILGLDVGDSEDETPWRAFLTSLKDRGLGGVERLFPVECGVIGSGPLRSGAFGACSSRGCGSLARRVGGTRSSR